MKRFLIAAVCVAMAGSVFAINVEVKRGDRIAVLAMPSRYTLSDERRAGEAVQEFLRDELAARGFDAYRVEQTYDSLARDDRANADFYVEISAAEGNSRMEGIGGVGTRNVFVDFGVLISRVAAEMRLYDGRTLELIDRFDLKEHHTSIAPAAIGVARIPIFGAIVLPTVRRAQIRSAAHDVATKAAERIASGVHGR